MAIIALIAAALLAATLASAGVLPAENSINVIGDCTPINIQFTGNYISFSNGNFSNSNWVTTKTNIVNCKTSDINTVTTFTSMLSMTVNTTIISVNNRSSCDSTEQAPFFDQTSGQPTPDQITIRALSPTVGYENTISRSNSNHTRGWHCTDPNFTLAAKVQWETDLASSGRVGDTTTTCNSTTEVVCYMPAIVSWKCIPRATYCTSRPTCFPPGCGQTDANVHYLLCETPTPSPNTTPSTSPTPTMTTSNSTTQTPPPATTSNGAFVVKADKIMFGLMALVMMMMLALQQRR